MREKKQLYLLPNGQLDVTLRRICHQLIEDHPQFEDTVMLAIQPRGVFLGRRIRALLKELFPDFDLPYGELDVTFQRDDIGRHRMPLVPNQTRIDFVVEDRKVILVDDVLYTGRTVRAALDAMLAFGRPRKVDLLTLVDRRRSRHLPIEPSYTGIQVDTLESE